MNELPAGYTILFNAITAALRAMEEQNFGTAREILIQAQQNTEEQYISKAE